ncbi:alpha-lactalbumin isoform X1 [Equus asinus]
MNGSVLVMLLNWTEDEEMRVVVERRASRTTTSPVVCQIRGPKSQLVFLLKWICTIFHSSGYDTQTIVKNNGKTEYGLFQINNKMWCRDNQILPSRNICGISCNKFLDDDLTDDVMCAKKILDSEGIDYWLAHKPLCSEKLEQWLCEEL